MSFNCDEWKKNANKYPKACAIGKHKLPVMLPLNRKKNKRR